MNIYICSICIQLYLPDLHTTIICSMCIQLYLLNYCTPPSITFMNIYICSICIQLFLFDLNTTISAQLLYTTVYYIYEYRHLLNLHTTISAQLLNTTIYYIYEHLHLLNLHTTISAQCVHNYIYSICIHTSNFCNACLVFSMLSSNRSRYLLYNYIYCFSISTTLGQLYFDVL